MPSTPGDISLAVDAGTRRMTYAELAAVRGTTQASAERLVRRRHWSRQTGNDGVVRVLVPLTEAKNPRERAASDMAPDNGCPPPDMSGLVRMSPPMSPGLPAPDVSWTVRTLESAIEALRDQLVKAEQKADADRIRAEHAEGLVEEERRRVDEERKRIDELRACVAELQTTLADAVAAERIAAREAAALRAELDRRREWSVWRRLGWALWRKT